MRFCREKALHDQSPDSQALPVIIYYYGYNEFLHRYHNLLGTKKENHLLDNSKITHLTDRHRTNRQRDRHKQADSDRHSLVVI